MSLTGVRLILLAALVTAAIAAATVLLWSRYGRWRLLSRIAGVLLTEVLVVLTIGLVVNREQQLYPSWQALAGDTGTTAVAAAPQAGRLDTELHGTAAESVPWQPADAATWRLAGAPTVMVPANYLSRPAVSYPVVLSLGGPGSAAAVVSVVAVPTAATTAGALATLPAELSQDLRVTARGWALVASAKQAALAKQLMAAMPGRFGALVMVRGDNWPAAEHAAVDQTSPPLAAPLRLPSAS
jgi:hypothetical protein